MSTRISVGTAPDGALLQPYRDDGPTYTDCYVATVPGSHSLGAFVTAFYTTWLFRLERLILRWFAGRPSSDSDVAALAAGDATNFAAWTVEARRDEEILLCDMAGRTRSWLMVEPDGAGKTVLRFGSAVVPVKSSDSSLGFLVGLLMPFHRVYSRALLSLAARRLSSG
ncbi:MAG: hypothetical protein AAFN78_11095 [Pseudomonadota bacterium]